MDAITLLEQDHKTVEALFARFEKLGPRARTGKQAVVERIVRELAVHAAIEEAVFYPAIRAATEDRDTDDLVLESLEEHHIMKWTLSELDGMNPDDERYDAKVTVLMESVRHHVEEEERELFPKAGQSLGAERLDELGRALAKAKKAAPNRPHPRLPDEPPGNILAAGAAAVDKVRDVTRRMTREKAKRSVSNR
jgi:hemerythrin superfamily protein